MTLQKTAKKRLGLIGNVGFRDPKNPGPKEKIQPGRTRKFYLPNKHPTKELYEKESKNPGSSTVVSQFRTTPRRRSLVSGTPTPDQIPGEDVPEMPEGYMEEHRTHHPDQELEDADDE